jgi:hypothetical protein
MESILSSFPKRRLPLPPEFQAIYSEQYKENREGKSNAAGLAQRMESWMHRKVAADVSDGPGRSTLEIGAGTLNHLPYEKHSKPYDIVEPFHFLYESSTFLERLENVYDDIAEIPNESRYERIVSIAAFEHICSLPEVVAKSGLLLDHGGVLRVAIPSEGTILWRLGYTLTTGFEFRRRYNLDYSILMKHEHVNTAREIELVLRCFFADVESSVFGVAKALSFYQFYVCRKPFLDICTGYLAR